VSTAGSWTSGSRFIAAHPPRMRLGRRGEAGPVVWRALRWSRGSPQRGEKRQMRMHCPRVVLDEQCSSTLSRLLRMSRASFGTPATQPRISSSAPTRRWTGPSSRGRCAPALAADTLNRRGRETERLAPRPPPSGRVLDPGGEPGPRRSKPGQASGAGSNPTSPFLIVISSISASRVPLP
jgi:hypothetical protein